MASSDQRANCGVLTMAIGPRHRRMAQRLAWSLDVHEPALPRAVITDERTTVLSKCFEHVVDLRPNAGGPLEERFHFDSYSPFAETLYIDADSLVVGSLDGVWELMRRVPFGVIGQQMTSGRWYGDVAEMAAAVGAESLPVFNGGLYYFDDSPVARSVFAAGRDLMGRYAELGLVDHPLGHSDEPVVAMALAKHGIEALWDHGTAMRTPIGIRGELDVDVLRGYCSFNKDGQRVTPRIMHFAGSWTRGFRYRRETLKLTLHRLLPFLPASVVSQTVNTTTNVPYEVSAFLTRPLRPWVRRLREAGVFG
jgi:hypothetical protein